MTATADDVLRRGREQARAGPWRGDGRVAYLLPLTHRPPPSEAFVRWAMAELAERGFFRVVTGALPPAEQAGYLAAGFAVTERLHVLRHDLHRLPALTRPALTRARPSDHEAVLAVDGLAFAPFWRLDDLALEETLAITPHTRFRLARIDDGVIAYAVTGRAGRQGFLQRVAVHPRHRRRGLGTALVVDALRWLRRWRVQRALVNTPAENDAALALYHGLGFRREPMGLAVLTADLR